MESAIAIALYDHDERDTDAVTLTSKPAMSSDFRVVAIVAGYNEADIIDHVVSGLINQGVHVYYLDDRSTDGTVEIVSSYLGQGVLAIEHLPETSKEVQPGAFSWERILLRKAQLAVELDAHWLFHHDADEFRESPWSGMSLLEAIRDVDRRGFNAIDFQCLDFWPVHDWFRPGDDVREAFTFYAPAAEYDRIQIKCWKKTSTPVDLTSTGGHEARFPGRSVFPVRFLLRHYPIRGQAHGERKVFEERRGRFVEDERARGWHVQYDEIHEGQSFIRDPSTLTPYKPDEVRVSLALRHRGVEELEQAVGDLRTDLDAIRDELVERTREVSSRGEELSGVRAELAAAHVAVAEWKIKGAALLATSERQRQDLDKLEEELGRRGADIARLQRDLADTVRKVEELRNSKSWRWTAPARAAIALLRGGKSGTS